MHSETHKWHDKNIQSDGCGFGKNIITFGVDNSSSLHADNKERD